MRFCHRSRLFLCPSTIDTTRATTRHARTALGRRFSMPVISVGAHRCFFAGLSDDVGDPGGVLFLGATAWATRPIGVEGPRLFVLR